MIIPDVRQEVVMPLGASRVHRPEGNILLPAQRAQGLLPKHSDGVYHGVLSGLRSAERKRAKHRTAKTTNMVSARKTETPRNKP